MERLVLIEYQDNFANNLTNYAYSKILEEKFSLNCCYSNDFSKRKIFEDKMDCFNFECKFISPVRFQDMAKKAFENNKIYLNKPQKNIVINSKKFDLKDIDLLNSKILDEMDFKNTNFVKNYDILEEIKTQNSIGLVFENGINTNFIEKAIKRLNKYIKKPKLYIFKNNNIKLNFETDIEYKCLNIEDYREKFYLLKSTKHKIITTQESVWAAILSHKDYNFIAYDKKLYPKFKKENWLAI